MAGFPCSSWWRFLCLRSALHRRLSPHNPARGSNAHRWFEYAQEALDPGLADAARPAWSPGGSQIAFQSVGQDSWADIYVLTISPEGETSELRPITEYSTGYAEEPSWSPDGTEIAFNRRGDIYKIDVNSSRETRLTSSTQNSHYSQPTWSPDGKQIAYVKEWYSGTQAAALYKMNSDGSNPTPVFEVEGKYAYHPDWGPRP